ncbi:IclR family transcriptional regulator [Shumkonia mesophila]|uniref:IclR family transcriptional regulator n=1 Tax=Shumkonia mesophila TaxID=2838854 RepID=UPI0029347C7A|nr:IclR family transcriptional regulator [Shumkonia mesophila]
MANFSVSSMERGLALLELLVAHTDGLQISEISQSLAIPLGATHRLLQTLIATEYVKQDPASGRYMPTLKLGTLGLRLMADINIVDIAQPILDDLARVTGELVRLAVVEFDEMSWIAKAQGSTSSIRCDFISGRHVPIQTTAMGKAWLAHLPENEARARLERKGLDCELVGPNAGKTIDDVLERVRVAREAGFALNEEESELGLNAVAIILKDLKDPGRVVGAVSVAGPAFRLGRERLISFVPALREAVAKLERTWVPGIAKITGLP